MRNHKKSTIRIGRKRFATAAGSAVAVVLSAAIVVTSVWHDSIEAQAADTLLGIEKLRNQVELSGKEYTILEIVPDKSAAEIGFLVDGCEPILSEWDEEKGEWISWKDRLVSLSDENKRKEFIQAKKEALRDYFLSQGWEEEDQVTSFPVYGVPDDYEESEGPEDGFEEVSGTGVTKTGYFSFHEESGGKYQIAFQYKGLNNGTFDHGKGTLYYQAAAATPIEKYAKPEDFPDDLWVYTRTKSGVYEPHLWGDVKKSYEPSTTKSEADPDEADEKDDEGEDGGNEGGDVTEGSGTEGGGDNEGGDEGEGGDNESGGDEGEGGINEGGGDEGEDGDNEGGDDEGVNVSTALTASPSSSQGKWIKMVNDGTGGDDNEGSDNEGNDNEGNDNKGNGSEGDDNNGDNDGSDEGTDLDDSGENKNSVFGSENGNERADYSGYYIVKFERIDDSAGNIPCYYVQNPDKIRESTSHYCAYDFTEVKASENTDDSGSKDQYVQAYTFLGKVIYCKNTFKSNEWFKKYVLNIDKSDYKKFSINVVTLTPEELNAMETLPQFDFLYLNSGIQSVGTGISYASFLDDEDDGSDDSDAADDEDGSDDIDTDDDDDSDAADDENDGGDAAADVDDDSADDDSTTGDESDDGDKAGGDGDGVDDEFAARTAGMAVVHAAGFKLYVKTGEDNENDEENDQENHHKSVSYQNAGSYGGSNDLTEDTLRYLVSRTIAGALPCLVDGRILYTKGAGDTGEGGTEESGAAVITVNEDLKATQIFRLAAMMCQDSPQEWYKKNSNNLTGIAVDKLLQGIVDDTDKNFVTEHVYCRLDDVSIINKVFPKATIYKDGRVMEQGFQRVLDEILLDNSYREADSSGNYKPLSTDIGQATAVRHIINYQNRRKVETKEKIKVLEIQPAKVDEPELTLEQLQKWAPGVKEADITVMTTAEFIGKIDKLNELYDLIYIGTSEDHLNVKFWDRNWDEKRCFTSNDDGYRTPESEKRKGRVSAGTVFNDSNMDGLIYYNIGDLRAASVLLAGQLDTEYVGDRNGDVFAYNYYRYGGNDITKEKEEALLSFLDGSYPVIVADDFMEQPVTVFGDADYKGPRVSLSEGWHNGEELKKLGDALTADVSSVKVKEGYSIFIFEDENFKDEEIGGKPLILNKSVKDLRLEKRRGSLDWNNCMKAAIVVKDKPSAKQIDEDHIDNCTYLYDFVKTAMEKNYTNFYTWSDIEEDSQLFKFYLNRPKVSVEQRLINGEREEGGEIYYINPGSDGRYKLEYRFVIHNEGAASANSRYQCRLYIDINSDGKFSAEEEVPDINLTQGGGYVSADGLYADREYTLTRGVPDGYKGLLPWKVEITQTDNDNIYASLNGFTKLSGMEKEKIKVIQIKRSPNWAGEAIDLEKEFEDEEAIYHKLLYGGVVDDVEYKGISDDYEIDVDCMTIAEYEEMFDPENEKYNPDCMTEYNMLILGFSDMYENFSGDSESGPMGAIVDFINSGKSVLFAHDTTSFVNYSHWGVGGRVDKTNPSSTEGAVEARDDFARSLNQYVRGLVGMDRYGILSANGEVSGILRQGQALQKESGSYDTIVKSGKDVAYEPKSNRERTVPQVHGYTYHTINSKDKTYNDGSAQKTDYTPAELDPDRTGTFTNTFRNIRYDKVYYEWGYNDFGDLEPTWNGAVSEMNVTQVNKGQITEYPYHLPEKFAIATTHGQYYELDFTADDDGDGQSDLVVWYCLADRNGNGNDKTIYSESPNDVRNNYYIYNKGNVTYTGMGHSAGSDLPYTVDETKLFINTIIAAYQAGVKQPNIAVLKSGLQEAPEMKTMYRYYDDMPSGGTGTALDDLATPEDSEKIYFRVQDLNFVKGTRAIATHVFYETDGGTETISVAGKEISVKKLDDIMFDAKDGSPVDANNLKSNGIYYILVPKTVLGQCDEGLNLYFEAQTTITTNTVNQNVYITDKVYAKLKVLKAFLFDLE